MLTSPSIPAKAPRARRAKTKSFMAGATAFALGASGLFLASVPASAAPGSAEAQSRYLSGSLLGTDLDSIAAVAGESARADASTAETVTNAGNLDLSVLGGALELQVADGISIPLSIAEVGAVTQYASASQSGSSLGATGAVTDQGVVDLEGSGGAPDMLTLDLTDLIGPELTSSVANLQLTSGVNTATATQENAGEAVGYYNIADLQAEVTSPVIADLSSTLLASSEELEGVVDAAIGPDGSLASGLTGLVSALGVADVTVSGSVDLSAVVEDVIGANQILGADGPVEINLATGLIEVDIAALLEANGRDLNSLQPGEEILTSELVGFITADVDELLNGLLTEVQEAVSTTLAATDLTVDAVVGPAIAPLLTVALDGTLGEISSGEVAPEINLLGGELDLSLVTGLITSTVNTVLDLELNLSALDTDLAPLYPALDALLTDIVSLQANVQENSEGTFTETALRLNLLNYEVEGEALNLNLAAASVGPNLAPTAEEAPTLLGLTPIYGPEVGGTTVTLSGTNLDGVDTVLFGGSEATALTAVSPTELTVQTPAGVGLVDVTVAGAGGSATLEDAFTYVPAGGPAAVVSFTPTQGPEAGGTEVTIIGSGFTGATSATFGDSEATEFTVVSDNLITAVTPAGEGSVAVAVVGTADGTVEAADQFTYLPDGGGDETVVTTVNPSSGPEAGGTLVTIGGSNLNLVDEVRFGGNLGGSLTVNSSTELTVVTPAGTGQVPITLLDTSEGGSTAVAPVPFSYVPASTGDDAPVIDSVDPSSGPTNGGTVVIVLGDNFNEDNTVAFGENPGTDVTYVSEKEIRVTTPAGEPGAVDVTVADPGGDSATLPDGYTYVTSNGDSTADGNNAANGGNTDSSANANGAADSSSNASSNGNGSYSSNGSTSSNNNSSANGNSNLAVTGANSPWTGAIIASLLLIAGVGSMILRRRFS